MWIKMAPTKENNSLNKIDTLLHDLCWEDWVFKIKFGTCCTTFVDKKALSW
jgi:hypothetical protein